MADTETPEADVMLDLETLGKRPGCAIVSIGACTFSASGFGANKFYCAVRLQEDDGHFDPETVAWWMGQSDAARRVFLDTDAVTLVTALELFGTWFGKNRGTRVWSNGLSFDVPIIEDAMRRMGVPCPWSYRDTRDVRTILALANKRIDHSGVKHNALDDALAQAVAVSHALRLLQPTVTT